LIANNDIYKPFLLISPVQEVQEEVTTCPSTMARGPMQPHRLKAGPACT